MVRERGGHGFGYLGSAVVVEDVRGLGGPDFVGLVLWAIRSDPLVPLQARKVISHGAKSQGTVVLACRS